jgi:hypothetical protein
MRSMAAIVVLFCATACSRRVGTPELAALYDAYKAGVLTKDEYSARVAAIRTRASQLAVLDRAMNLGLLSKDEYAAKKALLSSGAQPPATPAAPAPALTPGIPTAAPPPGAETSVNPALPAGSPPNGDGNPQSHSYRMKMAQILDSQGFERPIPSASLLIPVDWQSQGATTWNLKDKCNGVQTHLLVSSPDGHAFERFPVYHWVWADDPAFLQATFAQNAKMGAHACDAMAPMGAQEYLQRNLAKLRPGAQLVGFEPAAKLMEALREQAQQTEEGARRFNLKQQVKYDAIRARLKYSVDGKPMEECILAGTFITGTFGPMQKWSYNCVAYSGGQRAPLGTLDGSAKLFELIASTFRTNPDWQARIAKNALAMQQIHLKGIRDRAGIAAKSADDTRKTQQQMYENRQNAQDQNSTQFSQYIRGVETYKNPTPGETVDLDSNYGYAWVNNRGEYLLSDLAGFDPNSAAGNTLNWTPLEQVKK